MPMYEEHFGFREGPFSIAPDPRYLYMSEQHREALAHLLYGIQSDGGFVLLTGEVGTGKTTICRCLLEQLPPDCDVAFVVNPRLTAPELLAAICDEFGIHCPEQNRSIKVFVDLINGYLLDAHGGGRRSVLIIDEAQNLSDDVLEQIRLLTNLETNERKLLQIILLGQPELREKLGRPQLRQLSQRIIARYHLVPLNRHEVVLYVNHRLVTAGSRTPLFTPGALRGIYRCSGGIPRLINMICDRSLLGAYAGGKHRIDRQTVERAFQEVSGRSGRSTRRERVRRYAAGIFLLAASAAAALYYYHGSTPGPSIAGTVFGVGKDRTARQRTTLPSMDDHREKQPSPSTTMRSTSSGGMAPRDGSLPEPRRNLEERPEDHPVPTDEDAGTEPGATRAVSAENILALARSQGREAAYGTLFHQWGAPLPSSQLEKACRPDGHSGLECFFGHGGLDELGKWNRPAVLKLFDAQGKELQVALTGARGDMLTFTLENRQVTATAQEVLRIWKGDYAVLWRPPSGYDEELRVGRKGIAVAWLRSQLEMARGEPPEPHPGELFDSALEQVIREFQLINGLEADGIAGPQTLMRLAAETDEDAPWLKARDQ